VLLPYVQALFDQGEATRGCIATVRGGHIIVARVDEPVADPRLRMTLLQGDAYGRPLRRILLVQIRFPRLDENLDTLGGFNVQARIDTPISEAFADSSETNAALSLQSIHDEIARAECVRFFDPCTVLRSPRARSTAAGSPAELGRFATVHPITPQVATTVGSIGNTAARDDVLTKVHTKWGSRMARHILPSNWWIGSW
jgi:hypothetical protein